MAGAAPPPVDLACPNCGFPDAKPVLLTVHFATPDHPMRDARVLCCAGCTCRFYENQTPPDYAEGAMLGRGRVAFYVQQGAGLSLITRPLARVEKPPGSVYLEVGCGFGFGLDFATRAKGWQGRGIDPGQIGCIGAAALGVPIEQRYLGEAEPAWDGNCDVVMASETIEHVTSPSGFVATLRRALRPGGVLILTTPAGEELHAGKSPGLLVPLLSPGLHLVFQTRASLRSLLAAAGFPHVVIETDGTSLVATASDRPFTLTADGETVRRLYRDYLERRAATVPADSDLALGFAGRALQEAVNDGAFEQADRAAAVLRTMCRARFGFDLATLAALPAEAGDCALERLAEVIPLNLGGILLADALRRLASGEPRRALSHRFALAAAAADALRRALGVLAMDDGMSEAIAWAARAEALLCDAEGGASGVPGRLRDFPPAPAEAEAAARRGAELFQRALVCAVNAGHVALGRAIAAATGLDALEAEAAGTPTGRDALFCLAVLNAQPDTEADPRRAVGRFAAVLAAGRGAGGPLAFEAARGMYQALDRAWDDEEAAWLLGELRRLAPMAGGPAGLGGLADAIGRRLLVAWVNAGAYERAATIAPDVADRLAAAAAEPERLLPGCRDALFCLAVLDLRPGGDPERAAGRFERVRREALPGGEHRTIPDLFWAALRGEVQAIERTEGMQAARTRLQAALAGVPMVDAPADLVALEMG